MKKLAFLLFMSALVVLGPVSPISLRGYTPATGLASSPHDFTTNDESKDNAQTVGACTFCHTPHRALQTRLLWNHTLPTTDYTWKDVTATIGGTVMPTIKAGIGGWTGPTKLCLSCHDGSLAVGDIAWFNESAWTTGSEINKDKHSSGEFLITQKGVGDLSGNHPVAFPYPFQGDKSFYNGTTTGDQVVTTEFVKDPSGSGIRLFNDDGAGFVTAGGIDKKTGIECSSCHDPHNGPTATGDLLLRGSLTGNDANYICMKCHQK